MMTKLQKKNIFLSLILVLSFSLMGLGVFGIAHAQTQTIVPITPSGGFYFQNTGWNAQTFTANTQSIMNDQYIYIQVQGTAISDPFPRILAISVNGQVVHSQPLGKGFFSGGIGAYYTDEVQNSFNVQYPVTSAVSGRSTSMVLIGLTTWSGPLDGLWNVQANFIGIPNSNPSITIPIGGSSSSSGSTSSSTSTSTSSSTSSSGSSSSGGSTNSGYFIPYSELLFGIAVLALAGAFISKGHSERA